VSTDTADRDEYCGLLSGDLQKVAALITIRSAWSHDRKSREQLDRLIEAGIKVALPQVFDG
jgi:hypothetical protein